MSKVLHRRGHDIFALAGWLFADLLLVLTLVFIVSAPPFQQVYTQRPPTPPPLICGVGKTPQVVYVSMPDPQGLIYGTPHGVASFRSALRNKLGAQDGKLAGLVEVFGGGSVQYGVTLSQGAITAMKHMSGYVFTSKTAYFRNLWNGNLPSNTVEVDVFYLVQAQSCG